jgi:hypothetical protein
VLLYASLFIIMMWLPDWLTYWISQVIIEKNPADDYDGGSRGRVKTKVRDKYTVYSLLLDFITT